MTKKRKPNGMPRDISTEGIDYSQQAYTTESYSVEHEYTQDEINDRIKEHFDTVVQIANRKELISDFSKHIKEGFGKDEALRIIAANDYKDIGDKSIKDLGLHLGRLKDEIDTGVYHETVKLYGFAFHDTGHMGFYDAEGQLVRWRDLEIDEQQAQAFGSWISVENMAANEEQ